MCLVHTGDSREPGVVGAEAAMEGVAGLGASVRTGQQTRQELGFHSDPDESHRGALCRRETCCALPVNRISLVVSLKLSQRGKYSLRRLQ